MNPPARPGFVRAVVVAGFLFSSSRAATPSSTAPVEGLRDASARVHALTGARVVTAPGQALERGTILVRDGLIQAVGADLAVPPEARVWDFSGRTIYAGFIESDSTIFLPAAWKSAVAARGENEEGAASPAAAAAPSAAELPAGAKAWNPRVTPERRASRALTADSRGADALRKLGFTVAQTMPARGSFRGQSAVVSLGVGGFNRTLLRDSVVQSMAFERGGRRSGGEGGAAESDASYPTSLMGAVALARQTLLDAQWYADAQRRYRERGTTEIARPETNDALAALGAVVRGEQPALIALDDELDTQRAVRLADEFKLKLVLRASGYDYRSLRALPEKRVPMIVPLAFPEPPDVENADRALDISLDKLQHWELAPANPARLAAAGVPIALTTSGLRRPESEFWTRLRQAVQRGLSHDQALAALTTIPADLLGLTATHGTITAGKAANLVVTSGDLFAGDESEILVVWVDGDPFEMDAWRRFDARGTWKVAWDGTATAPAEIKITGRGTTRLRASAGGSETALRSDGENFSLLAPAKWFGGAEGIARLAAHIENGALRGTGELPDGTAIRWRAERTTPGTETARTAAEKKPAAIIARGDTFPAGAYGRAALPAQPDALLVKNATLWTCGPEGTLESTDLLIERGKISRVGRGLAAPAGATIVDATGRHISPGLIDCHSHMAISGSVNESSHSVTVEVRIGDALDATDIGLYRALAGGLTTANILHGSANAMGGQNQVIKLRWGEQPDGLKFAGAPPGVKFALGENVTRKNSSTAPTRYPASRLGVREIMLDTFTRARDYERDWVEFRAGRSPLPPRRDLRLEAALEILRGERLIHIHSYRQDEVLAFIRLAQQLKLPVATFQHILEGYKVADEIAALGAGASTFSDWWAYKHEVIDAIPFNGALLHAAGVVVSFNSDDDELTRHLNTEAAKAVKYGGVSPTEALKFVTLNPARQLRIDARVGSLQAGKDADFVIWNAPPLSAYARVEQSWIDGRRYFDRDEDAKMRTAAAKERAALIQKILPERQRVIAGGTSGTGGGGEGGGGDAAARPTILQILDQLAASVGTGEDRALYHDGGSVHNCSTCEGGDR